MLRPQATKNEEKLNAKIPKARGEARKVVRVSKTPRVPNLLGSESTGTIEVGLLMVQHSEMSNGVIRPSEKGALYWDDYHNWDEEEEGYTRKIPGAKTSSTYQV